MKSLKMFVPFIRTPVNIISEAAEWFVMGALIAGAFVLIGGCTVDKRVSIYVHDAQHIDIRATTQNTSDTDTKASDVLDASIPLIP
jgi:hypothetical protein|tara:strand:+ start:1698 stop:1955 length:258 start_codon:yes stop_codon:yes gene_type:complete